MRIFVDSREDGVVINAFRNAASDPEMLKTLKEKEIVIEEATLLSGDIVCGEYAIEHKTPSDYRGSLFSGHLANQVDNMKRNFKGSAIFCSGHDFELFSDKIGIGSVASFIAQGMPVIPCGNLNTMAKLSIKTLHKWNDEKVRDSNPNINQKRANDDQLNIITGISNISEVNGNALLNHFDTIVNIANAKIVDLEAIDGIGPKRAAVIYAAFHNPRW